MEQRVEIQERRAVGGPFCYDSKVVCLTADVRVPCRVKLANELAAAEQAMS
jgi:hypothetical protein